MSLVPFPGPGSPQRYQYDDPDELEREEDGDARMSFLEHLDELRTRLLVAVISIAVGFLVAIFFIGYIFAFIMEPLQAVLGPGRRLIYTEPTEAFMLQLKMAALAGLVFAAPVVMWQLWLFIAPGLYAKEKRLAIPFILLTTLCFVGGAGFSHFVIFPVAWRFFAGFSTEYMEFLPRIAPAFTLYAQMLIACGVIFQLPTLVFFLARLGLVTARFLIRNIKYAVLLIFALSAVITPTGDVVVQSLMAAPMVVLYLLSIGIAWAFGRDRRLKDPVEDA